jgi:hypothetical protein
VSRIAVIFLPLVFIPKSVNRVFFHFLHGEKQQSSTIIHFGKGQSLLLYDFGGNIMATKKNPSKFSSFQLIIKKYGR